MNQKAILLDYAPPSRTCALVDIRGGLAWQSSRRFAEARQSVYQWIILSSTFTLLKSSLRA